MAGNRFFSSDTMGVSQVQIPYLPAKVALEDLSDNGCLLSPEQLGLLSKIEKKLIVQRRYTKQEISGLIKTELGLQVEWPYSLIHHENRFYAIYKGEKQGKHLGKGEHGKVKLAQCLDDNVFYALKLQSDPEATNQEFNMLHRVGETPQSRALASRVTKAGDAQSMILMKLARGQGIDQITEQEIELSYEDSKGNQILDGLMSPILRIQLALDALIKLDKLHLARHVIHRDLQPGNIMLDLVAQHARLIDYGQAIVAQQVSDLKRSGSERSLKGSTRNYSPQLRRHLPDIKRAMSEGDERLMPVVTYDRGDEMYAIGISLASFFHLLDPIPEELEDKPEQWGSHLIEDNVAEACLPHYHILPMVFYRRVLALVRRMTDADEKHRIHFEAAITELAAMLSELKQAGEKVSVGLLDIVKIDVNNLEAMIDFVRQSDVDEIHLVDSLGKGRSMLELLTIQRQLQEAGFRVGGICFTGVDINNIEKAAVHFFSSRPVPSQHRWISVNQTLAAAAAAATTTLSSSSSSSSSSSPSSSLSDSPPVTMMMTLK